jgi:hypothetical protein
MNSRSSNTAAWRFQVWTSFVLSSVATGLGILYLPLGLWTRGYLAMGMLFTIGSCFSLAKTIRDDADSRPARRDEAPAPSGPFRSASGL